MTSAGAPIAASTIDGALVVAGPAATIRDALAGAQQLTITGRNANGDQVWLRGRQVYGDSGITMQHIARTITHPVHGEICYAWIDERRLSDAPVMAGMIATARRHPRSTGDKPTSTGPAAEARAAGNRHDVQGEVWD